MWFQKISIPSHGRFLVCIPPPFRNFRSKGVFDDPPSPQEFPRYANMVFVVTFTIKHPFSTYNALLLFYTICMFAIGFEMFCFSRKFVETECCNVLLTLAPRVAANNLRAECDVNNEAKILRIEIVFATQNVKKRNC